MPTFKLNLKNESSESLEEQIIKFEKEFILNSLQKLFLGELNGINVFSVNGDFVKFNYSMSFVEGGHYLVYNFIPEKEIWIDNDIESKDYAPILLHELNELIRMRDLNEDYETAHKNSNKIELNYRLKRMGL